MFASCTSHEQCIRFDGVQLNHIWCSAGPSLMTSSLGDFPAAILWLEQQTPVVLQFTSGLIQEAVTAGNIPVLQLLLQRCINYQTSAREQFQMAFWEHLWDHPSKWRHSTPDSWQHFLCETAASEGQLPVLAYIQEQVDLQTWGSTLCSAAAAAGQLAALAWLQERMPVEAWTSATCTAAVQAGQLEAWRWLCLDCQPPCPADESTLSMAAAKGHLETMKFLCSHASGDAASPALPCGNLECVKWLREQDPPCEWSDGCIDAAIDASNLCAIKYARASVPPCPWGPNGCCAAIEQGKEGILAWLLDHDCPLPSLCDYIMATECLLSYCRPSIPVLMVLSNRHIPLPSRVVATLKLGRGTWCMLLGLVRWARCTHSEIL